MARFDDGQGSSQGFWLIRELPGTYLQKKEDRWIIEQMNRWFMDATQGPHGEFAHLWGERWELHEIRGGELTASFKSRGEALMALEKAVSESPEPAIAELL